MRFGVRFARCFFRFVTVLGDESLEIEDFSFCLDIETVDFDLFRLNLLELMLEVFSPEHVHQKHVHNTSIERIDGTQYRCVYHNNLCENSARWQLFGQGH